MVETEPDETVKKVDPYLLRLRLEARLNLDIITPEERQVLQNLVNGAGMEADPTNKDIIKTGISVPSQDNIGPKPKESFMKAPSGQTPKNPL